jgi:glycosyltransferase involved in cell wall biosynthesis
MANKAKNRKRIGIDARFYGPVGKGLGRYTQEVVDAVTRLDQENEYVVFLGKENFNEFESSDPRVKKVLANVRWYTVAEQIIMPILIKKEKIDLMHFPHFNVPLLTPCRFVVTIHDLILTKHPTERATTLGPSTYKLKNWGYRTVINHAVKAAKTIIAVSSYTKADIVAQFKVIPDKVKVIYEGVAERLQADARADDKKVIFRYNIHKPYLLYVGNAYPHKNLEGLIEIFAKIKEKHKDLQLVLVGKRDYFYDRLIKQAQNNRYKEDILFPGFVPDFDLVSLYKEAEAYVFPSFFEGFGLPALEAMQHGSPVISSQATCLPEVLGEAAIYFNPEDKTNFVLALDQVLNNKELRQKLIMAGRNQVKLYSWQRCARETIAVYNSNI